MPAGNAGDGAQQRAGSQVSDRSVAADCRRAQAGAAARGQIAVRLS
jgi:hypothetical protein